MTGLSLAPTMSRQPALTTPTARAVTREEPDGRRQLLPCDQPSRLGFALVARPGDPRLRASVVEVRRRQGAGDPRAVRHVGHPLLPSAQRSDRPSRRPGLRSHAGQAAAPAALGAAACPLRSSAGYRRLTTARGRFAMNADPRLRRGAHRTGPQPSAILLPSLLAILAVTSLIVALYVWRGEDPKQPPAAAGSQSKSPSATPSPATTTASA